MLTNFKAFFTEEKITKENLERSLTVFIKIAEKKFATKFYRYAGPNGYCDIKNGVGILYFYHGSRAVRFNYIKGEITSISLWNNYMLGSSADFTVDIDGLSIVQCGRKILEVMLKPKAGNIAVYSDVAESLLSEASRTTPHKFYEFIQDHAPHANMKNMSWTDIADVALKADVQIPSRVKELRIPGTKGAATRFDLSKLLDGSIGDPEEPISGKNEPTYYFKITAQDPITKKFLSVQGDTKAEKYLQQASNAIQNPDVKAEMKDPNTLFGIMKNLTQLVCRGSRNALIVYGGPGIGKTFVVTETIKDEGLVKGQDWFVVKGKITTTALYQTLFMHRKGGLLVFDDTDSVAGSTEVITSIGSMPIEKLYDVIETVGCVEIGSKDKSVLRPKEAIETLSYIDGEVIMKPLNYIMKHKVNKKMFKITANGNSIIVTENHSCIVLRDEELLSIMPNEIQDTDRLIVIENAN